MIVAFATDCGEKLISKHFGDAEFYNVYEINKQEITFLKKIMNSTEEEDEEIHADPKKAGGIAKILKDEQVEVVISKVFGPNIKRIKKKFVCILVKKMVIKDNFESIQSNLDKIEEELKKGEDRAWLNL